MYFKFIVLAYYLGRKEKIWRGFATQSWLRVCPIVLKFNACIENNFTSVCLNLSVHVLQSC